MSKFKIGDNVHAVNNIYWGFKSMKVIKIWNSDSYSCFHPALNIGAFGEYELAIFSQERQDKLDKLKQVEDRIKEIKEELFAKK